MTYSPPTTERAPGFIRRWLDRRAGRRAAAKRRAFVEARKDLAHRVWAVQIAASTAADNRRPA
jgi:hypothetical protein